MAERGECCWSTEDVEKHNALAYWFDAVCRTMLELEIDSPARDCFKGRLRQTWLGPVSLILVDTSAQKISRTASAIARSRADLFHLLHLRAGRFRIEQCGRAVDVHSGDCVLTASTEPFRLTCPQPTRCLALQIPQEWLRAWLPAPEELVARSFAAEGGWAAALVAAMASLDFSSLDALALPRGLVAEQIAALLALSAGPVAAHLSARDKLQRRIVRSLREHCHELDLDPASVAALNGISKRYLHFLFAAAGTTFSRQLLQVRLDRARQMLGEAQLAGLAIGEVAARCGFHDASHFARRFRQRFGVAPTVYRNRLTVS